jgi:hypothetical protein
VSESLQFTILFEEGDDGWIVASIPEVPVHIARASPATRRGQM